MVGAVSDPLFIYALLLGAPLAGGLVGALLGLAWPGGAGLAAALAASLLLCRQVAPGQELVLEGGAWLAIDGLEVGLALRADPFAAALLLALSAAGLAAFAWGRSYARGDEACERGLALLGLAFAATGLVLVAGNCALLYAGWALLGLCSWMLLGAGREAGPAFVVERLSDAALLAGLLLLVESGAVDFAGTQLQPGRVLWVGLLLAGAALLKAGLFPLPFWLAGASRAPSPALVLVHAGAGVAAATLLVRTRPLWERAPEVGQGLVAVGAGAALVAALAGLGASEARHLLARTTAAQLGLVVLAVGLGAPQAVALLLAVHILGRGLLLLGAGSLVAAAGAGALAALAGWKSRLPVVCWTGLVGALALSGAPPLSGFWAWGLLLAACRQERGWIAWSAALAAILLLALHAFRLVFAAFAREREEHRPQAFRAPGAGALCALLALAGIASLAFVGTHLAGAARLASFADREWVQVHGASLAGAALAALLGALLAYLAGPRLAARPSGGLRAEALFRDLAARPLLAVARWLRDAVDLFFFEWMGAGGVWLLGRGAGWLLARAQSGRVRLYLLASAVGVAAALLFARGA